MPGRKTFWFISGLVFVSLFYLFAEGKQEELRDPQQAETSRYQEAIVEYQKEREIRSPDTS